MGLLDYFSGSGSKGGFGLLDNMDDPQQAGMMNMALGLLSQGGPSTTPTSLGQALGRAGMLGMQSMQQAQNRQLENRMSDMKMKYLQGQIDEQQGTNDEKKKISDFYSNLGRFSTSPESQALATGAAQGDVGPTVTNAERISTMAPGKFDTNAMYQAMLQSGSPTLAADGLKGLAKERPKVKDWQKVNVDGQVLYAPYFEDGTVGKPVPYQVAEKLHFANTGGETVALDPFTGTKQASIRNTQSPESVASNAIGWANVNLSRQRLAQEQANQNRPQFVESLGGFVSRPTAQAPGGTFTALPGLPAGSKASEDERKAAGWVSQAENAWKNMQNVMYAKDANGKTIMQNKTPVLDNAVVRPGTLESMFSSIGMDETANTVRNPNRQRFVQGASSMAEAMLRAATGAGINAFEAKQKADELTPRIGDSQAVIDQKMAAIPVYIESLKTRAGRALPAGGGAAPAASSNSGLPTGWSVTVK